MKFNPKLLAISLSLIIGINIVGCSKEIADKETNAQKNQTLTTTNTEKSDVVAREQAILDQNTPPIHAQANPDTIKLIPKNFQFIEKGYFTVAIPALSAAPLHTLALDNKTHIGAEVDIARLIADSLGLKLKLVPTTWESWPLGIVSGKFDAVLSNIAVREERKQKYDLVTYRKDTLAFYVPKESKINAITGADDISGLKIVVGSGTNQEKLLLQWIDDNKKKGLAPAQPIYLEDSAAATLALQSGRVDALIIPTVAGRWQQFNGVNIKQVGKLDGIWSVAVALKKDTGFATAVQSAINGVIDSGEYIKVFSRWNLQEDAVTHSLINPPIQD